MPQYKLTYFNARGRAEIVRLVFAQAGVEYEDKRITKEEWGELKPNTPNGVVPILEVDGKTIGGTVPIVRLVAERHGLAGSHDLENAEIASIMDLIGDLFMAYSKAYFFEKDETRKAELKKKFDEEEAPKFFSFLEKRVTGGWLYGSKVTYADLAFFDFSGRLPDEALAKFPGLQSVRQNVKALPNIAKWLNERPQTQF
jgi:glutathione S-transferase